jgi:hypothetical protein
MVSFQKSPPSQVASEAGFCKAEKYLRGVKFEGLNDIKSRDVLMEVLHP